MILQEHPVIRDLRMYLTGRSDEISSLLTENNTPCIPYPLSREINMVSSQCIDVAPLPVAAIKSLLGVIKRTKSETMMGLQKELREASELMIQFTKNDDLSHREVLGGRTHIALASGCELFMKYITRCFLDIPDFRSCISQILDRGRRFSSISILARDRIVNSGKPFICQGCIVLTHGYSRVVSALLLEASQATNFEIIVLEGRPDASGAKASKVYSQAGIPTTLVLDSSMAHVMERVDIVVVGAEGVMENGGIINKIGTYGLAIVARELGIPFYVAAESFKFARLFPLNQNDLPEMGRSIRHQLSFVDTTSWDLKKSIDINVNNESNEKNNNNKNDHDGVIILPKEVKLDNPLCDYTPAKYITLLFTDLGVLTPSAVGDELIRLYQ